MIEVQDRRDRETVERVLRSGNPGAQTEWEFWVGNRPLRQHVTDLSYGREKDGIAQVVEAQLGRSAPKEWKRRRARLELVVGGVPIERFSGKVVRVRKRGRSSSTLTCATGGWYADKTRLGAETSYPSGEEPWRIALAMTGRLPYYGPAVEVARIRAPRFVRALDERFREIDPIKSVMDALKEEAKVVFCDTRENGCRVMVVPPAAAPGRVAASWTIGRDVDEEAFEFEESGEEWRDVVVWRSGEDGSTEILQTVRVPGSTAPDGVSYVMELSDTSVNAGADALYMATSAATALALGEGSGALALPYVHPLLEEYDAVAFETFEEEDDYLVYRQITGRIDALPAVLPAKTQTIEYSGVVSREERVRKPEAGLSGRPSHRIITPPIWRSKTAAHISADLPWIREAPTGGVIVDLDIAAAHGVLITEEPTYVRVPF